MTAWPSVSSASIRSSLPSLPASRYWSSRMNLATLVGLDGHTEFGEFDRPGVLHEGLDDVRVHGDHAVDRCTATLRIDDRGRLGDVRESGPAS